MTTPINLNKARKAKAKAEKTRTATENREKFGRTKSQKNAEKLAATKLQNAIDQAKRER